MLGPLKFPSHSGHSPATYFHGNKSIMPDIMDFLKFGHTQRHTNNTLAGNTGACGSLQSRTRGIKKKKEIDLGFINMEEDQEIRAFLAR